MVATHGSSRLQLSWWRSVLIIPVLLPNVFAQDTGFTPSWVGLTDITAPCSAALSISLACDPNLADVFGAHQGYLDDSSLASLCVDTCADSLAAYKTSLSQSCSSADILTMGSLQFPASLNADAWMLNFDTLCRKDR